MTDGDMAMVLPLLRAIAVNLVRLDDRGETGNLHEFPPDVQRKLRGLMNEIREDWYHD